MFETISVIAVLVILTVLVGTITQAIVHRLNPQKANQPKPEGITKSIGNIAPIGFIFVTIVNIFLFLSNSPIGFLFMVTGPAMIVFGIMSIIHFVSAR